MAAIKRSRTPSGAASARRLASLDRRLRRQEEELRRLAKESAILSRRQRAILEALELPESPRGHERGVIRSLQDSIVRVQDYLLKTADRIENILTALKQHREFLSNVNQRVLELGTKDRIRLELDVMKNTLSILAMNGVDVDGSLVKDIDKLRGSLKAASDVEAMERSKSDLDRRFDGELKRFDLDSIWSKKKDIPGYR